MLLCLHLLRSERHAELGSTSSSSGQCHTGHILRLERHDNIQQPTQYAHQFRYTDAQGTKKTGTSSRVQTCGKQLFQPPLWLYICSYHWWSICPTPDPFPNHHSLTPTLPLLTTTLILSQPPFPSLQYYPCHPLTPTLNLLTPTLHPLSLTLQCLTTALHLTLFPLSHNLSDHPLNPTLPSLHSHPPSATLSHFASRLLSHLQQQLISEPHGFSWSPPVIGCRRRSWPKYELTCRFEFYVASTWDIRIHYDVYLNTILSAPHITSLPDLAKINADLMEHALLPTH